MGTKILGLHRKGRELQIMGSRGRWEPQTTNETRQKKTRAFQWWSLFVFTAPVWTKVPMFTCTKYILLLMLFLFCCVVTVGKKERKGKKGGEKNTYLELVICVLFTMTFSVITVSMCTSFNDGISVITVVRAAWMSSHCFYWCDRIGPQDGFTTALFSW